MICNSGLLITRKLKELVTGGDFSPSKRPAPPVKTINLKPISAEPVHGCSDIISPGEQTRLRHVVSRSHYDEIPRPNPPVGSVVGEDSDPRVGHPAGWNEHQRKIQMYESLAGKRGGESFESPNLVCGSLSHPRVPSNPHFSSLSRPGKTEPEFTKINGKTVRLYSSLPRPGPGRGRHTHYPPTPPLTPISPLVSASPASPPYSLHETHQHPRAPPPSPSPEESSTKDQVFLYEQSPLSPNYVALSDIYAELPRKKKKPCTSLDCTSVHHKHDLSSSSASQKSFSNDTESNKKFSTLDNANSKKNKVLQKFHSLDRGWKSLVSSKSSSNNNSIKSSSKSSSGKDSSSSNKTLSCKGSHTSLGYNTSISSNDGGSELSVSTEGMTYTPKNHLKQQHHHQVFFPSQQQYQSHQHLSSNRTREERIASVGRRRWRPTISEPQLHQLSSTAGGGRGSSSKSVTIHNDDSEEGDSTEDVASEVLDNDGELVQSVDSVIGNNSQGNNDAGNGGPNRTAYQCHTLPKAHREVRLCHRASNSVRSDKVPLATWEPFFCVLLQDETTFTSYRSEEMA